MNVWREEIGIRGDELAVDWYMYVPFALLGVSQKEKKEKEKRIGVAMPNLLLNIQ